MMNQPLRRVDPLGRSIPLSPAHPSWPWPATPLLANYLLVVHLRT
jgi:hypothetical protein